MKLISYKVRDVEDYIQSEIDNTEIQSFPLTSTKNAHASLKEVEPFDIWPFILYVCKFYWWKQCKERPHYLSRTLLFIFDKQNTCKGTILLEIPGIYFNRKNHQQQKQFSSSFLSPSNNWPKLWLLEHISQCLQELKGLKEIGYYWCNYRCFPICVNRWMTIRDQSVSLGIFILYY